MKNNSRHIVFCTALAALVVSMMLVPVSFAAIGVEEGDWAKYRIEAEIPEELEEQMGELEEIEWMKVEVVSVSDTTVTTEDTTHYKDGTKETETTEDAMELGFIIEADLGEGDEVKALFFAAVMTLYINGTVSRTYAGASREVNYVEITREGYPMTFMTSTMKAYWDKATGVMCENSMSMSGEYEGETVEMSILSKMTETNMWEAEPLWMQSWFWVVIAGIVILGAGATVVLLRRRRAPLPEVAPTPTE